MKPTEEDHDWLHRIKKGDVAAYSFLVDKYKYMIYTIALKILRNPEDAEDVAQECFLKAYQQIHQFQGKSKFSTWLYTITYRTAISQFKENRIQTSSISDEIRETYTTGHASPQYEQLQQKGKVPLSMFLGTVALIRNET
jgi:RNA polymerase sigma factor (sigma-70 family)